MATRTKFFRSESQQKAGKRLSSAEERECLAQALQANIRYIVDSLHFTESNLPDQLISSGQITEDECSQIRNIRSRKDQIRYLINRTKGRDLKDIKTVIELIRSQIPDVVDKIYEQFEENKYNHVRCRTCALCQCFTAIDIKDVIDDIWSKQAVSDGFYNKVILSTDPRGCQTDLWKQLIDSLNRQEGETKREIYDSLFSAILSRGSFDFLVRPMQRSLSQCTVLKCKCFSAEDIPPLTSASTDSQPSSTSSGSARNSIYSLGSISTCSDDISQANDHVETVRVQHRDLQMNLLKPQDSTSFNKTEVSHSNQLSGNGYTSLHSTLGETGISSHESTTDEVVLRKPNVATIQLQTDTVNITARNLNRHGRNMEGIAALQPGNFEDWINIMKAAEFLNKTEQTGNNLDIIVAKSVRQVEEWIDIITSEVISERSKRQGRNLDDVAAADPKYVDDLIKLFTTGPGIISD